MAVLIINPISDDEFVDFVRECAHVATAPADLQACLRQRYPNAVARSRELDGETRPAWYVYREGRWVPPAPKNR